MLNVQCSMLNVQCSMFNADLPCLPLLLKNSLRPQTFELHFGMIDEFHRLGEGAMAGSFGDQGVHLLADTAIGGMSLRRSSKLEDVHGFACVHIHVEPDAICHRD